VLTATTSNGMDFILIKFDAAGNQVWEQLYNVNDHEWAGNLCLAPGGGFVFSGITDDDSSGLSVATVIKADGNGNKLSEKIISNGYLDDPRGLVWSDNGYVYFGGTVVGGMTYSLMLMRVNL